MIHSLEDEDQSETALEEKAGEIRIHSRAVAVSRRRWSVSNRGAEVMRHQDEGKFPSLFFEVQGNCGTSAGSQSTLLFFF